MLTYQVIDAIQTVIAGERLSERKRDALRSCYRGKMPLGLCDEIGVHSESLSDGASVALLIDERRRAAIKQLLRIVQDCKWPTVEEAADLRARTRLLRGNPPPAILEAFDLGTSASWALVAEHVVRLATDTKLQCAIVARRKLEQGRDVESKKREAQAKAEREADAEIAKIAAPVEAKSPQLATGKSRTLASRIANAQSGAAVNA